MYSGIEITDTTSTQRTIVMSTQPPNGGEPGETLHKSSAMSTLGRFNEGR
jgi:hypothetical protein